ncbi:MAG: L-histidine N(alpha)-methyltransferase [Gammaproteobacteria bacterium]
MDFLLPSQRFHIKELSSNKATDTLKQDVLAGLFSCPRSLPPKYFYDDEGSKLFDAICQTEDYYPTRSESQLLREYAEQIIEVVNPNSCAELGAGTSTKTEILLSQIFTGQKLDAFTYLSIDVCAEVLVESAHRLLSKYENLYIQSIVGEYIPAIQAASKLDGPTLYAFIGSSIGNFTEQESIEFLSEVATKMTAKDYFLIGMDRVKDKGVLERAYDDREGVTAKFNLNVLSVLNNKLGADFDLSKFSHQATYNEQLQQIEMYLISQTSQDIRFSALDKTISLEGGEKILTEVSRKYTKLSIEHLLDKSGLMEAAHFQPANEYFSLMLAKRK